MKEDGWSKSIIAVAQRRQHQTYQHQSDSVMAAASQSGMCTRRHLSSGSILRRFVQRGQWRCQRPVMFAATTFYCWSLFFFCRASRSACFLSPTACVSSNYTQQFVNLRGDASERIAFIHMPAHIPGSLYWRLRQPLHTALCIKSIQIHLGIFH